MRVMIVFEVIPESTSIYLLDLDGKDLKKVKKAHGVYVNISQNDKPAIWLDKFLDDKNSLKKEKGEPFDITDVKLLIHSGFKL